jgi:hypothetical protein
LKKNKRRKKGGNGNGSPLFIHTRHERGLKKSENILRLWAAKDKETAGVILRIA